MRTETSILLPAATVDLFVKDKETIEAAQALQNDWRFARVKIRVQEGTVETATKLYAGSPSPEIVMIETDTTESSFITRLTELSAHCEENTSAVVIGPVNDVNLYRSLTSMGVSDYLVRPVPQETLGDVIAQTLIEKLGTSGSRLVAVIGAKGGVGVSALCEAIAFGASEMLEQKTLLLDAAGAWSSLGVGMGFEPVGSTAEAIKAVVARDTDSLRRMLYTVNDKLSVLATGTEPMLDSASNIAQFEEIINATMSNYPLLIADLSGASPAVKKTILTRAHEVIVVSTPTLSSLRSARTLMQEIKKLHGGQAVNVDLVINMAGMAAGKEVPKSDIKAALDCEPEVVVAFDPKLFIGSENEGRKLTADKTGQDVVRSLLPMIRKIVARDNTSPGDDNADAGLLGGILGKLKKK